MDRLDRPGGHSWGRGRGRGAADRTPDIAWHITDEDTTYLVELRNGVLTHRPVPVAADGITAFTLSGRSLIGLVTGTLDLVTAMEDGTVAVDGDPAALGRLVGLIAPVDPDFAIVTP